MFNLSTKQTVAVAVVFSLVLWATRGQHVASLFGLPDATWAISFMVGFLFGPLLFAIVLAQAFLIDYLSMGSYLFNLAYLALLPAYLALYFAGKWFRGQYDKQGFALGAFALSFVGGVAICEFIVELFGQYFFDNLFFAFCYVLVFTLAFYLSVGATNKKLA
jgi:hypothetical protein